MILTLKDLQVGSYEEEKALNEFTLANPMPFKDGVDCFSNNEKIHLSKEHLAVFNAKIENWLTQKSLND